MGNKTAQVLQDQGPDVALNNLFDEKLDETKVDESEVANQPLLESNANQIIQEMPKGSDNPLNAVFDAPPVP